MTVRGASGTVGTGGGRRRRIPIRSVIGRRVGSVIAHRLGVVAGLLHAVAGETVGLVVVRCGG